MKTHCEETKYKKYRMPVMFKVPEAVIVGPGFGKWCRKKGSDQMSKISFQCYESLKFI